MTVRSVVIGAGYWGRNLIRNLDSLNALYGFCETDPAVRSEHQTRYPHAAVYPTPAAAFADDQVDAVAIATPAVTHGELVAGALSAGKHVFVEKPLCLDLDDGRRLADQADRASLILMVGHLLHYHPAFGSLRAVVNEGWLGPLRYLYSHRLSLGKIRREENALWSFAPHDISMILSLVGAMPTRIQAAGGAYLAPPVADTSLSHLTFADNIQGHIFVSWLHPYKDHRMVVVGETGMAVFDDVKSGPDKLLLYRHDIGWNGNLPAVTKAAGEPIAYDETEPLRLEMAHFLDCVTTGRRPVSDAEEGLRVLAVLDACQRSLRTGQPVAMDPA